MKKLAYIIVAAAVFAGCSKNILDRQPNDQITEREVFGDILVTEKFLTNIYSELHGAIYNRTHNYLLSGTTDEAEIGIMNTGGYHFNTGSFSPVDFPLGNYWNIYYSAIRKTNIFLANIDQVPGDPALIARMRGEAQFLQAWFYQQLFKAFGSFIIVDRVLTVSDGLNLPRNSVAECAAFITGLCDQAAAVLPPGYQSSQLGRITKGAALALKAEALLFHASPLYNPTNEVQRWTAAADAAAAILDDSELGYGLYGNYTNLFIANHNEEVILAYNAGSSTKTMESANSPSSFGGTCAISPTQELVDAYEMANGLAPFHADGTVNPVSGYSPNNPYANRDPRFYATILFNGAQWQGRGIETFVGGSDEIAVGSHTRSQTGYFMRKFLDESVIVNGPQQRGATWILYRLGTVLLDYAEARNEASGPDRSVYDAVNRIRSRAGMPELPEGLDQAQMRDRIRHERRIEMAFEDNRFWDVRRWKIGVQTFGKTFHGMRITRVGSTLHYERVTVRPRIFDDRRHLFPLPQSEINKNSQLFQNPNW